MDEDLKRLIEEISVATHRPFDDVARDVQRPFDITTEDFRHQLQLVSEGDGNVINERIAPLIRDLMNKFAESKAIARSYFDIDRRLRSLEDRVERLESSSARPQ